MPETIDLTPTWAEWALLYQRLAESGETAALDRARERISQAALRGEVKP